SRARERPETRTPSCPSTRRPRSERRCDSPTTRAPGRAARSAPAPASAARAERRRYRSPSSRLLASGRSCRKPTGVGRNPRSRLQCVSDAGWRIGRLQEIPPRSETPGFSVDEYRQAMAERAPHILKRWADAGEQFAHENRTTHDVRGFLGVESFGVNAFGAHEGELLIVP